MVRWLRIFLISLLAITMLFVALVLSTNYLIKQKIENFLDYRLPSYITHTNSSIKLNSFEGTITINNPVVNIKNQEDNTLHTKIDLDKIIIEDVSYWDYIFKNEIHIEDIKLLKPNILYYKDVFNKAKERDTTSSIIKIFKPFIIDELSIDNTTLHIYNQSKDSLLLYVEEGMVEIDDIVINAETITKKIPATFKNYEFKADSIFLKANNFENLTTSKIKLKNKDAIIKNIKFQTKYSRKTLSNIIKKERDHFNLNIDSLNLSQVDFGFKNRKLFVKTRAININEPNLNIFRDKLVADDLSIKKLYSHSLRDIPFNLTIDSIKINKGKIDYTEKVKVENNGGQIEFKNFNAIITNVSNTYNSPVKTTLDITGYFMDVTPFKANWTFDVNNKNDDFVFKMDMDALEFPRINEFTEPNLKVRFKGKTNKMYFTIDGNKTKSTVDMKVNYQDLEINILNKNGNQKKWLLSKIANLFVSKDSKDKDNDFREAITDVERDQTKSVFNFIWLNTKQGLLKSMTGDGEKQEK